jgi:hypothetical protein
MDGYSKKLSMKLEIESERTKLFSNYNIAFTIFVYQPK